MIFFLRVAAAVASVEAYFADEGYYQDDWRLEQACLREMDLMQEKYGRKEVPSYWEHKYNVAGLFDKWMV